MRPEQLRVQAFGCYLTETTVDFSALNGKVFLITGSTGGGKTTLLDGMCFALYCRATGGKRTWSDMRSISAGKELPTEVEFTFRLGEERYRFRRSLKIHTVRGSGRTELRDEHACWRMKGQDWELMVSGAESKVRDKAQELLGLTCEQFSQVVVLPQGDFRKLLLSNSNEKARIFQTLFQTERWERVTRIAQKMAEESKQALDQLFQNRTLLLNQEHCADIQALKEKAEQTRESIQQAKAQWEQLEQQARQVNQEYTQASVTAEQFEQLDRFAKEQAVLLEREPKIKELQQQWEESRRIKELLPYYQSLSQTRREYKDKQARLFQAKQRLEQAQNQEKIAADQAQDVERLRSDLELFTKSAGLLEEAKKNADKLAQYDREIDAARKALGDLEADRIGFVKAKEQAFKNVQAGETFVREISEKSRTLPEGMARLSKLQEMDRNFLLLEQCIKQEQSAQCQWRKAAHEQQAARVKLAAMQEKMERLERALACNAAGKLAAALKQGQPCPVCGSLEHPRPAHGLEEIPEETQQKLLRESVKQGEQELSQKSESLAAAAALFTLKQKSREEQQALCDAYCIDRAVATAELERAQEQVREARKAQEQLPRAEKLLEQRRQEQKQAQESEEACREQAQLAATRLTQLESGKKAVLETLPQGLEDRDGLDQQYRSTLTRIKQAQEKIKGLEEKVTRTRRELDQAKEQYLALRQGVMEEEQKLSARIEDYTNRCEKLNVSQDIPIDQKWIGEQEMQRIEGEIQEHRDRVLLVSRRLSELKESLQKMERQDVQSLREELTRLREQAGEASERAGGLSKAWEQMQKILDVLLKEEAESAAFEEHYARTARVAQLLTGGNRRKIPIRMFVLGIMLDDILSRANLYFATFSSGRYRLIRPENESGGRGFNGLELQILDGYSGGVRAVETLSGGELFLASLSLAFGLSDVVQGHSGGVRLDSIFIDEGFGSLDQETLDTAMRALNEVQRSGRTVGIISHVQELKALVPARIEVLSRGDGGSAVRVLS
ncbi:MAG: SMC family ATPase [Clostridiales bacterium]|jgi:exonuclease SbcC|nr:SMC family ATPase [Clostridiales bacterium]